MQHTDLPLDIRLMTVVTRGLVVVFVLLCVGAVGTWIARHPSWTLQSISVQGDLGHQNAVGLRAQLATPLRKLEDSFLTLDLQQVRHMFLADLELNYTYTNNTKHTLALTAYYMHYKNQLVLTGNLNNVGTPIQQNVDNSYRTGIELNGATQLHRKLRFEGNVALSQNKIASFEQTTSIYSNNWDWLADTTLLYKNVAISFSPQVVAAAMLTYQPCKGAELALTSKYVGKQYLDNTQNPNRTLNAYWVNNAQMSYTRKTKWCKEIGFNVQLNNLLNTLYEANGWTYFVLFNENNAIRSTNYNNYYPQAGFNFLAGLSLKW